jgi:hypothetical protein
MRFVRSTVSMFLILVIAAVASTVAVAQDATPAATPGGPSEGYPVAIHQGSCDDLAAEPVQQFDNAVATSDSDEQQIVGESLSSILLETSGEVDLTFGDLGSDLHSIAVHASSEAYDTIVACGHVSGVIHDEKLVVALIATDGSTTFGVAILEEGEDQTEVTVYVFTTSSSDIATPGAS